MDRRGRSPLFGKVVNKGVIIAVSESEQLTYPSVEGGRGINMNFKHTLQTYWNGLLFVKQESRFGKVKILSNYSIDIVYMSLSISFLKDIMVFV